MVSSPRAVARRFALANPSASAAATRGRYRPGLRRSGIWVTRVPRNAGYPPGCYPWLGCYRWNQWNAWFGTGYRGRFRRFRFGPGPARRAFRWWAPSAVSGFRRRFAGATAPSTPGASRPRLSARGTTPRRTQRLSTTPHTRCPPAHPRSARKRFAIRRINPARLAPLPSPRVSLKPRARAV